MPSHRTAPLEDLFLTDPTPSQRHQPARLASSVWVTPLTHMSGARQSLRQSLNRSHWLLIPIKPTTARFPLLPLPRRQEWAWATIYPRISPLRRTTVQGLCIRLPLNKPPTDLNLP